MYPNYDYHYDRKIALAAAKYDQTHSAFNYDEITCNPNSIPIAFYDIEEMSKVFPVDRTEDVDEKISSLVNFRAIMESLFLSYNGSLTYSPSYVEDIASGLIIKLYQNFSEKLLKIYKTDFQKIYQWVKKWRDVTIEVIEESFEWAPTSKTVLDGFLSNSRLLSKSLSITYGEYDELVRSYKFGPMAPASNVILFNIWGESYFQQISEIEKKFVKSEQDLQMECPVNNICAFRDLLTDYIIKAVDQTSIESRDFTYREQFRSLIFNLFTGYIEVLRHKKITDPSVYSFCADYWCDLTNTIIRYDTYVYAQKYRLADYHEGDIIHREIFISSERDRWDILKQFVERSEAFIRAASFSFIEELRNGVLKYPWHQSLKTVGICYMDLYKALCPKYISGISLDYLKHCIESANFSHLQELCDKTNEAYGVLRFIVIAIGKKCKEWRESAASSLKDSNGKPYSWRTLDGSITSKKEFIKIFLKEIDDLDTGLDFNWLH